MTSCQTGERNPIFGKIVKITDISKIFQEFHDRVTDRKRNFSAIGADMRGMSKI